MSSDNNGVARITVCRPSIIALHRALIFSRGSRQVDNGYHLYINEKEVGSSENWFDTDVYTFDESCDQPTVYAIDAYDTGGTAASIMEAEHCGELIVSGNKWKCHQFGADDPPDSWKSVTFDDSEWPVAGDAGDNGVAPWGMRRYRSLVHRF